MTKRCALCGADGHEAAASPWGRVPTKASERARRRRERIAESEGKTVKINRNLRGLSSEARRQLRMAAKREARRLRAMREGREFSPNPRKYARCDAHVAAFKEWRRYLKKLHDAHVRRFRAVMKERANKRVTSAAKYQANPEKERARSAQRKKALPDSYVALQLRVAGMPKSVISPAIIQLKREQMSLRRLSLELKQAAANHAKEARNETI